MNLDLLPYEINTLIISYLVPKNPKSILDIESYLNLSVVNTEFRNNVVKYKKEYIRLKDILNEYKISHKFYFEIVKYELMDKFPIILPSTSNEGCLICGKFIPCWWPMLFSSDNKTIRNEEIEKWDKKTSSMIGYGCCGRCDYKNLLCSICSLKICHYKTRRIVFTSIGNHIDCVGCSLFKICKWCDKDIHPLRNIESQFKNENYIDGKYFCSLQCLRDYEDYQFFVFSCR